MASALNSVGVIVLSTYGGEDKDHKKRACSKNSAFIQHHLRRRESGPSRVSALIYQRRIASEALQRLFKRHGCSSGTAEPRSLPKVRATHGSSASDHNNKRDEAYWDPDRSWDAKPRVDLLGRSRRPISRFPAAVSLERNIRWKTGHGSFAARGLKKGPKELGREAPRGPTWTISPSCVFAFVLTSVRLGRMS